VTTAVVPHPRNINHDRKEHDKMATTKPIRIPKAILEELATEVRIVLPDETRGLFPLPIDLIRNEAFIKKLAADKYFQANFEVAIISKSR
jgi:hypothetical protein